MIRQKPYIVAITGASGAIYGVKLTRHLLDLGYYVALTISGPARLVIREELGIQISDLKDPQFLELLFPDGPARQNLSYYHYQDLTAPIASGSYPVKGMIIVPSSTTCFSRIANGVSETLIERAAECIIKEGKRLVIVPRETPMSALHLEHLLKLARVGVRIVPAIPAFYSGAQNVEEMIDFVIGKALDQLEVDHALFRRWTGSENNLEEKGAKWTEK